MISNFIAKAIFIGLSVLTTVSAVHAQSTANVADAGKADKGLSGLMQRVADGLNTCRKPSYPPESLSRGDVGEVRLTFLIGIDGRVVESKVINSSGHVLLDQAAQAALLTCQFSPALKDGAPVESWAPVAYVWELDGMSSFKQRGDQFGIQRTRAEAGDADEQRLFGHVFLEGLLVEQSLSEAEKWFRKSAEQGSRIGQFDLGVLLLKKGGDSAAEANIWLSKAAEAGVAEAANVLGKNYEIGRGVAVDPALALSWFVHAAESGSLLAQAKVGRAYLFGDGVKPDDALALFWYRKAALRNLPSAQLAVGYLLEHGKDIPHDLSEAAQWYRKAADNGDATARFTLGLMYAEGNGVTKSFAEAIRWMRLAADSGLPKAELSLGRMYSQGQGVDQDQVLALQWIRKAAAQGLAAAQTQMGHRLTQGVGAPVSKEAGLDFYRKAAKQGDAEAQAALADMQRAPAN
ncbi:TonB family protein [Oxalobacteraceae bacterium]|nr:TonB family protein [Oxalobacteraceae bacterium]